MKTLTSNVFFLLRNGSLLAWDYKNHKQYEIEEAVFKRLQEISKGAEVSSPLDTMLESNGFLVNEPLEREWGWDDLSWIFHQGTKNPPVVVNEDGNWFEESLSYFDTLEKKPNFEEEYNLQDALKLPPPNATLLKNVKYLEVLKKRRTSRTFSGEALSQELVSTLLHLCFSFIKDPWKDVENFEIVGRRRTSPSPGGTHSCDAYIYIYNVEDIKKGIYRYIPKDSGYLEPINLDISPTDIARSFYNQSFSENLSLGIFLISDFSKVWWKYTHSRAYRHVMVDAGHLSQTVLLTATALGLLTWQTAAFRDKDLDAMFKIKKDYICPITFIGVGTGRPCPLPPEMF